MKGELRSCVREMAGPHPSSHRWREQGQDKDKALLFSLFFTSSIFQDPNPLFTAEMKLQSVSVFLA